MPSIRLDKQIFPFFNSVKDPITAPGVSESFRNNGFSTMTIEVVGASSANIVVEGVVNILNNDDNTKNDEECIWSPLAILSAENFDVLSAITKNGIYYVGINGTSRVRIKSDQLTGNVVIVGSAEA